MDIEEKILHLSKMFEGMQDKIAEFQIDTEGRVEQGYNVTDTKDVRVIELLNFLLLEVPNFSKYLDYKLEIISFHPADGLAYKNTTIVGAFKTPITAQLKKDFCIPEGRYAEGFVIKFDLADNSMLIKLNDLDFDKYVFPKLPLFSIASKALNKMFRDKIGVGVHFSCVPNDVRCEYIDYYFVNPFRFITKLFFKKLYPNYDEDFWVFLRAYGVTVKDGKVIKMKRYIYWNDKSFIRFYQV